MRASSRRRLLSVSLPVFLFAAQAQSNGASGGQTASQHIAVSPAEMKWGPAPPGLPAGGQMSVLSGDPGKPAPFAISLKLPDGYVVPPHWHPTDESVVVVSGVVMLGMGDKAVVSMMKSLGAGSFAMLPQKSPHYVTAKGATTLVISAVGPFEITYIDPKDDPRNKKD